MLRRAVAHLETSQLDRDDIVVQLLHGPLLADGSFDQRHLNVVAMLPSNDGTFQADFTPDRAGRWGATARAMPTHPHLMGRFDTGHVALG